MPEDYGSPNFRPPHAPGKLAPPSGGGSAITLFIQRVIDGLANGSLYGALGLALAIVYRASGRINMAQGEFATVGTYISLVLSSNATPALAGTVLASRWLPGTPWPLGLAIAGAMVVSAIGAAVIERLVVRPIPERSPRAAVSVTIGLLLLANAFTKWLWRPANRGYRSPFPNNPKDYFHIGGARLRYTTVGTWVTLLIVLGLLWVVLRYTKAGLAFRAVSSSRAISELMGIRSGRVLTGGWALAGALGTLVGCLIANTLVLSPDMMVRMLIYGFAAATIGGLSSPGGALVGGIIVGLAQTMLSGYVGFIGAPLSLPTVLLLMVIMLYLRPAGLFGTRGLEAAPLNAALPGVTTGLPREPLVRLVPATPSGRTARTAGIVAALAIAVLPVFVLPFIEARLWTQVVATAIALWGLGVLMGPGGQLSLGHGAFLGIGAYTTLIASSRYGTYPLVGLLIAAAVGFVVGLVFGLPALRIRGQYLAMVTLSLAVAFPMVIQRFAWLTGGSSGPRPVELKPPSWFDIAPYRPYVWLHLAAVVAAALVAWLLTNLDRSTTGRAMRAAAENDHSAAAMGIHVVRTKALTFGVVAMLGAVAGGLIGLQTQAVTTDSFDVFASLALYAAVVLGGPGTLLGGALSAIIMVGIPWFTAEMGWRVGPNLLFGLLLVVATALFPDGVAPSLARGVRRGVGWVDVVPTRPATGRSSEAGTGTGAAAAAGAGEQPTPAGP